MKHRSIARVSNEQPDGLLEEFKVGPITLTLEVPLKAARQWSSPSYNGECEIRGNVFRVTVAAHNVVVHAYSRDFGRNASYTSIDKDIDRWGYKDEQSDEIDPPNYQEIRQFVGAALRKFSDNIAKFIELSKVREIGGNKLAPDCGDFTPDLGTIGVAGWKLTDHPTVTIGFDVFDDVARIFIKQRVITVPIDVDRQSAAELVSVLGQALNKLGFPGDKHAEIDVILRDKRVNQGKRILRYNVKDYKSALEQLKDVLERHKVQATIHATALTLRTSR